MGGMSQNRDIPPVFYSNLWNCYSSDSCELGGDMIRYSGVEKKLKTGSRGWYDTGITKRDGRWRGEAQ